MQSDSSLPRIPKKYKLVLLGESGVGKSSIVQRLVKDEWSEDISSTVGASFFRYACTLEDGVQVYFDIWDTAGQERYRSLASMYYRGAAAALVVYEVTAYDTFEHAKHWVQELLTKSPETVILLVGNKRDLEAGRKMSFEEGSRYAAEMGLMFMEVSARDGGGVRECFDAIARRLASTNSQNSVREGGVLDAGGSAVSLQQQPAEDRGCC